MTKKRAGIALVMTGAVLLLAALLLFAYNRFEDARAGEEAAEILAEVHTAINEAGADNADETKEKIMPTVNIHGHDYIGYLHIPDLALELPVMADWDYNRLKRAPCRHFGTTYNDDLVIAAHNYKKHFGLIDTLPMGAEVTFTDMDGIESAYAVREIIARAPDEVAEVRDSQWDLILYTCTYGGDVRIVVGCERVE